MNKIGMVVSQSEKAAISLAERHFKQGITSSFEALCEYACLAKHARAEYGTGCLVPMKNAYEARLEQLKRIREEGK
jgi:hypothetical protein